MKNATLRQLRIFSEVARYQSLARAAESLHLTAPAISQQIKALETHCETPLLIRTGKRIQLTTSGDYLLVHVKRILAEIKDAEDTLMNLQNLKTGALVIGMVSTAEYFVPRMLSKFGHENPEIEIKLVVGNRSELTALLHDSEVDIAIMGRAPANLPSRAEPFAAHPHVFIGSPGHPLSQSPQPKLAALQRHGLIVREPTSGTRAALTNFLDKHSIPHRFSMEMHSNETIKQAVIAGMGISFLSLHVIGLEITNGLLAVIDFPHCPVIRGWNVVTHQTKVLSPVAEAFRYFMLENGERFLAQQFGHFPVETRGI